ncbi:MAG: hypothetical protein Q7R58_02190, partial [bacterium]|nr:hypothetical protein [bacterium]
VSERFSKSKNYLNERAKQIDASASEMGGIEKLFRRMGENYNKLSLVHKLGIGLTLGAGAVISVASFAPLMALGFGTALGAQRAFGLGSMFVSQEKALQAKRVGESEQLISVKERAMLNAMLYTLGMSFAIKEGIELANEYGVVERTREWLGGMLGHNTVMSETAVPASAVAAAPEVVTPVMPEVSEPAAAAAAGEPVLAPTIDSVVPADSVAELPAAVPDVSVDAVKGRGYEYMMKRMWEQLQDKGLDASQYAQDSDIHKLLTATPEDIDTVVHQIASDPEHNFYRPDGTSVRIDMDSKMTLNADGTIQLGDTVKAPENVPITPAQYPETPAPNVEESVASAAPLPPPADTDTVLTPPVEEQQSFTPLTHDSDIQSPAPVTDHSFVVNRYGLNIPVAEPHIYGDAGAKHLFVYGGTPVERATAILHYLEKNPNGIIFDADNSEKYRIPWHLVDGKVIPDFPARTGGFLGFFSTWMKPPGPDDLRQLIK